MDVDRYRRAEEALWSSVGVAPTEHLVHLERTDATVRVLEVGDGPPVVFVHGASNAGTSWAPLAAHLGGMRCLLVDRPGCGLSMRPARPLADTAALEAFADDLVVDVVDAIGLPQVDVVATSFGGYFMFRGAAAHPARVRRLVELSWTFGAPAVRAPLAMRIASLPSLGRIMTKIPPNERMVRSLLRHIGLRQAVDSGRFGPVEVAWYLALLRDTDTMRNEIDTVPRVTTLRGFSADTLLSPAILGRVSAPAYLLWGADDPMGGADIARDFARKLPDATVEVMAGAGHAPWIDDPVFVASRVRGFLAND